MKKLVFVIVSFFYTTAGFSQVTFSGTILNSPTQRVYLINSFNKTVDSAKIDKNHAIFDLKADIKDESYFNIFYQKKGPYVLNQFVVMPGEHVVFSYDIATADKNLWIKVSGSPTSSERITALKEMYGYKLNISNMRKEIDSISSLKNFDSTQLASRRSQINSNEKKANDIAKLVFDTTKSSFNGRLMLAVLRSSNLISDDEKLQLIQQLQVRFPNDKSIAALTGSSNESTGQGLKLNSIAFNISLKDTGDVQKDYMKSNFKFMLIDFWASWCKPCREESPNLVGAMDKFESKGFKVLAVSVDTDKSLWLKAIHFDKTSNFYHVNDPAGTKSKYLRDYQILALPANFLIDSTGKVVAKNLRGTDLYKKLDEIFK
ncbi:TlpA family protein disulfide reductase [Mucilaginibacter litoreus]|uniref:TlpA family protein disulfide reductase n=1 Tax=Mucilaginibacter litoreus TaxID=1048221 RepID=A0ABW3AQS2_9SPHI